jgi:hypothetical protein
MFGVHMSAQILICYMSHASCTLIAMRLDGPPPKYEVACDSKLGNLVMYLRSTASDTIGRRLEYPPRILTVFLCRWQ